MSKLSSMDKTCIALAVLSAIALAAAGRFYFAWPVYLIAPSALGAFFLWLYPLVRNYWPDFPAGDRGGVLLKAVRPVLTPLAGLSPFVAYFVWIAGLCAVGGVVLWGFEQIRG